GRRASRAAPPPQSTPAPRRVSAKTSAISSGRLARGSSQRAIVVASSSIPAGLCPCINIRPSMGLADTKKEFIAVRTARGIAARKLFDERAHDVLRQTVLAALADEAEKERTLDEEARRMIESARNEIASS